MTTRLLYTHDATPLEIVEEQRVFDSDGNLLGVVCGEERTEVQLLLIRSSPS